MLHLSTSPAGAEPAQPLLPRIAAFAGEVEAGRRALPDPASAAGARVRTARRRRRCSAAFPTNAMTRGWSSSAIRPSRSSAPAKSAFLRSPAPRNRTACSVREADPVAGELACLGRREQPGGEAGRMQQAPEVVPGIREGSARRGAHPAGVDAAEDETCAGLEHVRDGALGAPPGTGARALSTGRLSASASRASIRSSSRRRRRPPTSDGSSRGSGSSEDLHRLVAPAPPVAALVALASLSVRSRSSIASHPGPPPGRRRRLGSSG